MQLFREGAISASDSIVSDATGTFEFDYIEPGTFLLQTSHPGFRTTTTTIIVQRAETRNVTITLPLAGVSQQVVVTAADQVQPGNEVSKSVSVISRDEIMNRNAISLAEILSTTPGLVARNQGGPGQYTSLSFRGLPSSATAILVDGMRLRDASATQGDATALVPELNFINADHIEILRGSGSALYGTQAAGGAVNIVSDPGGGPIHGDTQVEGGNLGLFRARGNIAGGALGQKLRYSAGILHLNVTSGVDGQDANRSSALQGFARYDFTPKVSLTGRFWGSDDFVQANNSPTSEGIPAASIPAGTVVQAIPLSMSAVRILLHGGMPDYANATYIPDVNDPDSRISSRFENAAFLLRHLVSSRTSWQAGYQLLHTQRIYENGPLGVGFQPTALNFSKYAGTIHTANLRGTARISSWLSLTGGYEFEREEYFDNQDNHLADPSHIIEKTTIAQNSNSGFFAAQMSLMQKRLQVSISGRAQQFSLSTPVFQYSGNENPYAGVHVTPPKALTGDLSLAYLLGSNMKLRAHAGNAYRAPSLYERFGAGFYDDFFTGKPVFSPYGDPRLAPDRYNSFDAGLDQYLFGSRLRFSGTFFYTRIVELIAFNSNGFDPATDPFARSYGYFNGAGGISRGTELSLEAHPEKNLTVSASYTYVNSETDQDNLVPGFYRAFDLPRHTLSLVATRTWANRFTTTLDYVHYSSYYDPYFAYEQAYRFPGYGRVDLTASYSFWRRAEKTARIYSRVSNVLDETYYVTGNLAPRATFVAGLGWAF